MCDNQLPSPSRPPRLSPVRKLALEREIEEVLTDTTIEMPTLSRPAFNSALNERFAAHGWETQPLVFSEPGDPSAKLDFLKERVGIEVGFGHASFVRIDLLKFQVASYSGLDRIDVGVYIASTRSFQAAMARDYQQNWAGSLTYEKIVRYLPHFKSAIQVPIYVIGLDL